MTSSADVKALGKRLPPEFVGLASVLHTSSSFGVNVIGVVGDWLPPAKSRGTDFMMTFTIHDDSILSTGLRVKFFKPELHELPEIKDSGDVVLLRNVNIKSYQGSPLALASWRTQWTVFAKNSIASSDFRVAYATPGVFLKHARSSGSPDPSVDEQQYIITLRERFESEYPRNAQADRVNPNTRSMPTPLTVATPSTQRANVSQTTPMPTSRSVPEIPVPPFPRTPLEPRSAGSSVSSHKFALIKDIQPDKFCDLVVEAIKWHSGDFGIFELYVTDYTVNNSLYEHQNDGSELFSPARKSIVEGKRVLKLELHSPHAFWVMQNVVCGQFLCLRNVRPKIGRSGFLEGNMWTDRFHPDKVCVSVIHPTSWQVEDLKARRAVYLASNKGAGADKKSSRNRKKRKNANKTAQQQCDLVANLDEPMVDVDHHESVLAQERGPIRRPAAAPKRGLNKNITVLYEDEIGLSTFGRVVDNPDRRISRDGVEQELPFINVNHRVRLRVLDFFPHSLRDFAVPCDESQLSWNWDFMLVLCAGDADDSNEQSINVEVHGEDAEQLLCLPAVDLRKDQTSLNRLRYVLSILWGPLEEEKDKFIKSHPQHKADEDFTAAGFNIVPDNVPFEGCIREYGLRVTHSVPQESDEGTDRSGEVTWSWERMYRLFGTKINA